MTAREEERAKRGRAPGYCVQLSNCCWIAGRTVRMKQLLYTARHPHMPSRERRQLQVTRYHYPVLSRSNDTSSKHSSLSPRYDSGFRERLGKLIARCCVLLWLSCCVGSCVLAILLCGELCSLVLCVLLFRRD